MKHTPEPWDWHWRHEDGVATGSVFALRRPGHAYAVAMCPRYQTREQWEADARLISAAPDMLAALYEAREFIDGMIDVVDGSYGEPAPNRAMSLAREIDAAIAKATGGA